MARSITKHALSDDQTMFDYLRDRERTVDEAHQKIAVLKQTVDSVTNAVRTIQTAQSIPLNVTGLIGQLGETQYAKAPPLLTAHPDLLNVPYDWYVLSGAPNTVWGINRTTNPPSRYQII